MDCPSALTVTMVSRKGVTHMHRGFFKVWYKIDRSAAWSRGLEYRGLMTTIMQHEDLKRISHFGGQEIPVGSIAVVVSSWAPALGLDRMKLTRMLKTLAEDEFIQLENVNNRFCVVSVVNHERYQTQLGGDEKPASNKQSTNEQLPLRDKENIYITRRFLDFARKYQEHQANTHGNRAPKVTDKLIRRCAESVGRMVIDDKFELDYIRNALAWAQNHEIWGDGNLLSLAELRKKKKGDDRTKFQKVAMQYDRANRMQTPVHDVCTDARAVYGRFR